MTKMSHFQSNVDPLFSTKIVLFSNKFWNLTIFYFILYVKRTSLLKSDLDSILIKGWTRAHSASGV